MMYSTTAEELTSVANAIREKTGDTAPLVFPQDFIHAIENIEIPDIDFTQSAAAVSSLSGTTSGATLTKTLEPGHIYLILMVRASKSSSSTTYYTSVGSVYRVYMYRDGGWKSASSGSVTDYATFTLSGNSLSIKMTSSSTTLLRAYFKEIGTLTGGG